MALASAASYSWARQARSRSARPGPATRNPARCRMADRSPATTACAPPAAATPPAASVASPQSTRCGATKPQIAGPGHRVIGQRRRGIAFGRRRPRRSKSSISLVSNPVRPRSKSDCLEVLQLQSQQFLVPVRPGSRPVHHEPEGLDLRRGPLVAQDDRDLGNAHFARALRRKWPSITSPSLRTRHGNLETKFPNAAAHAVHGASFLRGLRA